MKLTLVLSLALAACGGGTTTDATVGFVGVWTFSSGSLAATCGGGITAPAPFDLTGLTVTFAKVDASTISLTAGSAGCTVDFGVSGDIAQSKANQKCVLALGGGFGNQTVAVQSWTLTRTDDRIESNVTGAVLFCSVGGTGVLSRGSLDASVPDGSGLDGAAGTSASDGAAGTSAVDGAAGEQGSAGADGGAAGATGDDGAAGAGGGTVDAAPDVASDEATSPDAGAGDASIETGTDAGDAAATETGD